jgi:hypothetical protein
VAVSSVATRRAGLLALAAAGWTLFVWGGRIRLLTGDETAHLRTWLRVGTSLAFGVALAVAAFVALRRGRFGPVAAWASVGFAAWMLVVWVPDVVDLFRDERTAGFIVVHVALATVSIGFGVALAAAVRGVPAGRE